MSEELAKIGDPRWEKSLERIAREVQRQVEEEDANMGENEDTEGSSERQNGPQKGRKNEPLSTCPGVFIHPIMNSTGHAQGRSLLGGGSEEAPSDENSESKRRRTAEYDPAMDIDEFGIGVRNMLSPWATSKVSSPRK